MTYKKSLIASAALFLSLSPVMGMASQQDPPDDDTAAFETMFPKGELSEEDIYRTDRLLLTATGSLKPVHLAPSVATVITAEDIEKMGATTLDEALETVPGLHISPSSRQQMSSIYSFRGIHTSVNPQVLVLMNGVPIADAYTGSRASFRYPVATISRIEVVRGPGSAVHGADAFSGIINIITKDGQELDGTTVGGRVGSFDTYEAWAQHGNMYNGWNVGFSMEYEESRGDKDRKLNGDLQAALDAALGTTASLTPNTPLATETKMFNGQCSLAKDGFNLRLWGQLQDDDAADGVTQTVGDSSGETKQFVGQINYEKVINNDLQTNLDLSYNYMHHDWVMNLFPDNSLLLIGSDGNIDFSTPTAMALFPDGVYGLPTQIDNQFNIESSSIYEGFESQRLRMALGFRYLKEEYEESKNFGPGIIDNLAAMPAINVIDGNLTDVTGTSYIYMDDQDRKLYYLSIQDEWTLAPKWELTAGARYDHYSDFGDTINPRLALVWETRYDLTTKLMYGRAFRPPSFTELYAKNNPSNTGNEDLDPETINTYELAFDYQPTNRIHLMANTFYYEIQNLIELVYDNNLALQVSQNNKDQQGYGFELEVDWDPLDTLRLRANFAHQRSKDMDTKEVVADAPAMQAYLNVHWQFLPEWSVDGQYYWIGERHRADGDSRDDIKDNDIVNMTLRRKNIMSNLDLAVKVSNLFNEDIREPSIAAIPGDYPMEGRSIYGEIRLSF